MTLDQIVDDFIRTRRASADADLEEFRKLSSLKQAIRHGAHCHWLPEFKRHPHQYRIPLSLLQTVERKLQRKASVLRQAASFEVLHATVAKQIGCMRGIGPLTVYDIAHRIGAFLGKAPMLVYLHRGARVGARRLGFAGDKLNPKEMPPPFLRLTPAEIEDCLCIYSDHFLPGRLQIVTRHKRSVCIGSRVHHVRRC